MKHKNVLSFVFGLLLVAGLCILFHDELTDPQRWIKLPF